LIERGWSRCARSRSGNRRNGRPSKSLICGLHQAASCRSEAKGWTYPVGATVAGPSIATSSSPSAGPLTVRLARCPGRRHATISVERKRGHGQRQRGQLHQQQQVVITGDPVEPKATAVRTSVDEDPPALPANGDGDRLHPAGTGSAPITGDVAIEVPRPEAGGAVIAMGCARRVVGYGYAAVRALEGA
jgi:hypothetical protein